MLALTFSSGRRHLDRQSEFTGLIKVFNYFSVPWGQGEGMGYMSMEVKGQLARDGSPLPLPGSQV